MNDWNLIDEEIIRAAGELRPAPRRLRRRVLRAAKKARRRRQARRRVLLAAAVLLPLAALGTWYHGEIVGSRARSGAADGGASPAAALDAPPLVGPAAADDWQRVDASINDRRKRSRAIRSSLLY